MKNIYKALANFQQEVPIIHKGTAGYGYSYADLTAIFTVINPLLKEHGLGFTQLVNENSIKTVLFHIESGETLESTTNLIEGVKLAKMNDFQVLGSQITYIRRYALSSLLGLVTDKYIDGDGDQKPELPKEKPQVATAEMLKTATAEMLKTGTKEEATAIWNRYQPLQKNLEFIGVTTKQGETIANVTK